jgi:hypothetical protein
MRICAVACALDSHELLRASMTHLVLNGIRDFYLYDHGSDPHLASVLCDAFGADGVRVTVLRKETPPFFQSAMLDVLTTLARMDGFETALAFDADEFWCSTDPGRTLSYQISAHLTEGLTTLRVPVLNYVQHREVATFDVGSLATARYAVVPHVDQTRPDRERVDAGMPFVAMPFPSKVIARLSSDLRFTEGQHGVTAAEGTDAEAETTGIIVRHLSLPARAELTGKREHGRRRVKAGTDADIGWQLQRLAGMTDEELDAYWDNNSWRHSDDRGVLVGSYDRLIEDDALVQIGRDLAAAADRLSSRPDAGVNETTTVREIGPRRLERLLESMVDDLGAADRDLAEQRDRAIALQAELHAVRSELAQRDASVAQLQHELAAERVALDAVECSVSWRLTAPLRAVGRRLRPPGR